MAAAAEPIENERFKFQTKMVNGKAQIYFDAFEQTPPTGKTKAKRNSRATVNPPAPPPPPLPQPKPKPVRTTKPTKVTFKQDQSKVGVFMTMEEIAELVRNVKEGSAAPPLPPPPPPTITKVTTIEQPPPPPPQPVVIVEPPPEVVQQILAPISPRQEALGMMADKKRQKWMREKAEMDRMKLEVEYDQLKHQLTPQNQRAPPPMVDPSATVRPVAQEVVSDPSKTRLMEKKQQQWRQENAEKAPTWNPFGRPGAGAPNTNELPPRPPVTTNVVMPYRPPEPTAVSINDQTRVPAAMRTNLLFGDVRFEDDVRTAKEIERRQWLDDLRKQIEENKKQKSTQLETERRQDFLQENIQPLLQEAANRHPTATAAPPPKETSNAPAPPETNRSTQHDSVVQQTYKKILEATELAKYEKKAQLIEKLKRNGHKTDLLAKTLPEVQATPKSSDTIFDSPPAVSKKSTQPPPPPPTTKVEPLHLNMGTDPLQSYRGNEGKRDEAVNTINSTFRSDNSVQTDFRLMPPKQMFVYSREESDLPPQVPNHLLRSAKQSKKNVRIRSSEDPTPRQRRNSATTTTMSKDDGHISQMETQRTNYDLVHRPLWNYQNQEHRVYVPNSQRDPKYQKKQPRQEMSLKSNTYNRWNSEGDLKKERATTHKPAAPVTQTIVNLPPRSNRAENVQMTRPHDDRQSMFSNISSLDRYEHFIPYTRTDEVLDPARAYSPVPISREPSAATVVKPTRRIETTRSTVNAQAPPYHVPPSRQDHILQQLSAIKENLVRRQQELTSSMNAIPV